MDEIQNKEKLEKLINDSLDIIAYHRLSIAQYLENISKFRFLLKEMENEKNE